MKYRVFNTIANRYVTDEEAWILKPDGRLAVNEERWFEFWKKKEMIGYQVLWVEDEETPSDDVDVFKNIRNLIQEE